MHVLRIEHPVPDYDAWKRAFDGDPVGRQRAGVRRYRVCRPVDDPHYVLIDLELDTRDQAEAMLGGLRTVWERVEGTIVSEPKARILEPLELVEY